MRDQFGLAPTPLRHPAPPQLKGDSYANTYNSKTWVQSKLLHVYFQLLIKIIMCSKLPCTKCKNHECFDTRSCLVLRRPRFATPHRPSRQRSPTMHIYICIYTYMNLLPLPRAQAHRRHVTHNSAEGEEVLTAVEFVPRSPDVTDEV